MCLVFFRSSEDLSWFCLAPWWCQWKVMTTDSRWHGGTNGRGWLTETPLAEPEDSAVLLLHDFSLGVLRVPWPVSEVEEFVQRSRVPFRPSTPGSSSECTNNNQVQCVALTSRAWPQGQDTAQSLDCLFHGDTFFYVWCEALVGITETTSGDPPATKVQARYFNALKWQDRPG